MQHLTRACEPNRSIIARRTIAPYAAVAALLIAALLITSCAPVRVGMKPPRVPPPPPVTPPDTSYGVASWYGPKFHGNPTSSGEIYDMYKYTAAHKEFAFGTRLRVTFLKTNRSTVVVVNDRGPFIAGRDLDLSYAAAKDIGLTGPGTGRVKMQYLGRDVRYKKAVGYMAGDKGPFAIQLGSFAERSNARKLMRAVSNRMNYTNVYILSANVNGRKLYRVRVGMYKDRDTARRKAEPLAYEGYGVMVVTYENP